MTGRYLTFQHSCALPYPQTNGDLWECSECGKIWKAYRPGNPAYDSWKGVLWPRSWWLRRRSA